MPSSDIPSLVDAELARVPGSWCDLEVSRDDFIQYLRDRQYAGSPVRIPDQWLAFACLRASERALVAGMKTSQGGEFQNIMMAPRAESSSRWRC